MGAVPIEEELLQELFRHKAALIQAITVAVASGTWETVMPAFDDLLGAVTRLEAAWTVAAKGQAISGENRA